MRYVCVIEIALPLERTAQLLADPTQIRRWLRGVESHEPISGEHGQVGTRSRVVMRTGERRMEAAETITRREPADLGTISEGVVVRYEREIVADGMWNAARERLTAVNATTTSWRSDNEYRFDHLVMRLIAPLMKRTFRQQSLQHMRDFKAFAERGVDVREGAG